MSDADPIADTVADHLADGRAALRTGRWADACAEFRAALAERETPEALEGLGEALWWQCEAAASVQVREQAYVGYRRAGAATRACRVAIDLCITYAINLDNASASRGWLARAESAVRGDEPGPMGGWLCLMRGFLDPNAARARELFERALAFARHAGDADLELVALADLGLALVTAGSVNEGLALLDEAMAGTLGGERTRLDTVVFASCNMLAACSLAGDLERAVEWCRVADAFMRTYSSPFLFARCRVYYGTLLLEKGEWAQAEAELRAALDMSEDAGARLRAAALACLADLRARQGRTDEAAALIAGVDERAAPALPVAAVRLACGESALAAAVLERGLEGPVVEHVQAAATLALLVEARLACDDGDGAAEAAERLHALARTRAEERTAALAARASAQIAAARGETQAAVGLLERALERFAALGLPLEAARTRLALARLTMDERHEVAVAEARLALAAFDRLGARADADAAAALLRSLGATGPPGPRDPGLLTRREREVLDLVGLGLSNPEIAGRLFISRKTVGHHVSRLLGKLGLRNRAEAAAYAARARARES